jgi:hypothetical protein
VQVIIVILPNCNPGNLDETVFLLADYFGVLRSASGPISQLFVPAASELKA